MSIRLCASVAACLLASACASYAPLVDRPGLSIAADGQLPEPTREDFIIPSRPYAVGPSDQLSIDVFGIPELSKTLTVDLTGQISMPLIGSVNVSGKTVSELSTEIAQRLRSAHVRNPNVTVNVAQAASQVFTVDGQVQSPGIYPLVGRMSLLRAIARASGTSEFAKEDYVVVFRQAGGKRYVALYDIRAMRQGLYDDPEIFSNDIIFVGESSARRIFKDVLAAAPLITTPIIALLR